MLERTEESILIYTNKTQQNRLKTTINHSDSIRNNLIEQNNDQLTEWEVAKRIYDWSLDVNELASVRYLFTPNLEMYVDYDLRKNEY